MNRKKWVLMAVLISVSTVASVFVFNYLIDPRGNRDIIVKRYYKPVLNERNKKYDYIFYRQNYKKYDSIVLGSSRVMKIVPSHFTLKEKFYNFAVHTANTAEKLFIIKEWLKKAKLKKIYMGVEFYNFHKNKGAMHLNRTKFTEGTSSDYLSISTLKLSIKSLKNKLKDEPQTYFEDDGSINYFNKDRLIEKGLYDFSEETFRRDSFGLMQGNFINDPFEIDERVFELLKEIKNTAVKDKIKLYVFLTPNYKATIDFVNMHPDLKKKFDYIRTKLKTIFENFNDFSIDSRYNDDTKNFYDPWHYRDVYGDKIVNTIDKKQSCYEH